MKKVFLCFVLFFIIIGIGFSQSSDDWKWGGLVRTRPLATVFSLIQGGIEIAVDWIPYITPSFGIPVEINFVSIDGVTGIGIMGGVEGVPLSHREKSGLFITALGGFLFVDPYVVVMARANAGYQLVTNGGFVLTSAVGVSFNIITGFSLDFMLDIGFAYRKK